MSKIPTSGLIFFFILLTLVFLFSRHFSRSTTIIPSPQNQKTTSVLTSQKTKIPEVKLFIMSFCPYSNQIETSIRPVVDLLNNQINITPHYIFEKIDDLAQYCQAKSDTTNICDTYVKKGYYANLLDCQSSLALNNSNCLDEKNYLKTNNKTLYGSLHGRQEANQNVRELCAWKEVGTQKEKWWNFISNINKNCTAQNADTCWEEQGKMAGLDTDKITDCFNRDAVSIIENELSFAVQYNIHTSPTILINDTLYPPENSYVPDNKGTLSIGNNVIVQNKYRNSESIKLAFCNAMLNESKDCQTKLLNDPDPVPNAAGCEI